jgi:hypothetical protein
MMDRENIGGGGGAHSSHKHILAAQPLTMELLNSVAGPRIFLSAPALLSRKSEFRLPPPAIALALAPAPDSYIRYRYLENYLFFTSVIGLKL